MKLLKILWYPFGWVWYYILDPRGLKPSEISKNLSKGQDAAYTAVDKTVEKMPKRKKKK